MVLHINTKAIATGRARCNSCGEFIKKGMKCIYVSGWRTAAYNHKTCPRINGGGV